MGSVVQRFHDRGGWWVAGQVVLFVLLAAALVWGSSLDSDASGPLRLIGASLFLAGCALGVASLGHLGRQLTPYPRPIEGGELVETGLYAHARHPIYGGVVLIAMGAALFDGNLLAVAVAAAFPPYFWAKSGHEERMLLERYPGYAGYRMRVRRRLIPWLL